MNEVKLRGKFLAASEIKEVGANGTKIRQFWIDVSENPEYPNTPELQLINDKCVLVDNLKKGDEIEVSGRLKGRRAVDREGTERVYTNIDAWRIMKIDRNSAAFANSATTSTEGSFAAATPIAPGKGFPF